MINIYLSTEEYHYDVHALVKAFYPEDQVKVIVQSPVYDVNSTNKEEPFTKHEEYNEKNTINKKTVLDNEEISHMDMVFDISETAIIFKIFKNNDCIYSENCMVDTKDKKLFKNYLKRLIYHCLSSFTGKELPWGTLTGVRPTKIAYEMLEQNKTVDEIKNFMKEQYLCSKDKIDLSLKVAEREITLLHEIDYKNGYSVYIGIPFCPSTCLYCSFTSYPLEQFGSYIDEYLQALFKEITFAGTCYQNKKLSTIYVGGGTPTTLSANQLEQLLAHIKKTFDFTYVSEFTVEAGRPDSITLDKLKVLKNYGVTRISINPQTMNQKTLDLIGRKHTVKQIIETYNMAREIGHDNINMDIILGLTGENVDDVSYTLNEIGKLSPDSLTVHTLAIKRAARLNIQKDKYQNMAATDVSKMLKIASEYTKSADYLPYYLYRQKNMTDNLENVGYAKFGKEGLYNILIMEERQTILALGAGGLCKFVFHDENRIERVENVKSLKDYIERIDEMIERKRTFISNN